MEIILDTLVTFGIRRSEAQIYIYLAKAGPHKCRDICNGMNLTKHKVYLGLKKLREKGIIKATASRPVLFYAIPFERVMEAFVDKKLKEAQQIQQAKEEIIGRAKSLSQKDKIAP